MCNAELEIAQTVVENASYVLSVHDVVAIILFLAVLVFATLTLTAEMILMVMNKDIAPWENAPKVKKTKLIVKGFIGITVVVYIIYLLVTWSMWNWKIPFGVFLLPPAIAIIISMALLAIGTFFYKFLYEPLTCLTSYFKKK